MTRVVEWSARRPRVAVLAAAIVLAFSLLGISRMHISGSFADMFGSDNEAAAAMARIASEYRSTDELLVLVTLPAGSSDVSPLVEYARRLEAAIAANPDAAALVAHVRHARDPAFEEYIRRVVVPAGAYFLSDTGFDTLIGRLTREGMGVQIRRGEAMIAAPGPAASAIAKSVLRDPLRIAELVDAVPGARSSLEPSTSKPARPADSSINLSADRRTLLIRVAGHEQVNNLDFSRRFTDRVSAIAASVNTGGLTIELAGGYAIAAATSRGIRRDSILSVSLSVVLLHVIFIAFYRRPGAPLLIGAVAAVGILAGFGIQGFHSPTITPLTAVIAALLAGLGIDYGIHFLSHYQSHRAAGMASGEASVQSAAVVGVPIVTNCLTSIFGFASLWPSQVRMLSDFALLGSLGLLGSLVSVFVLMPALLALVDRRPPHPTTTTTAVTPLPLPPRFGGLAAAIGARPRACMAAAVLVLVFAIVGAVVNGPIPRVEGDLSVMHPRPNAPLETTNSLGARFGDVGESVPIEIRADSADAMLIAAHDTAAELATPEARSLGIQGVLGLHNLLPDPRKTPDRMARLAALDPDAVIASFDSVIAESAFDPAAFTAYRDWLRGFVTARPPQIADLESYPALAEQVFPSPSTATPRPRTHTSTLLAVRLAQSLNDRARRDETVTGIRAALHTIHGATLSGMSAITYDLEYATRADLPRSVAISLLLVVGWLALVFRRASDVALALTPLLFAVICTTGAMAWTGLQINAVNGVAIPLLNGIAVDAGVFLVATARANARDAGGNRGKRLGSVFTSTAQAVLAASTTTIAGFTALCFTSTPAIRSLGMLASIGVTASLCGSLLLLMPLLLLRNDRAHRMEGNAP